MFYALTINKTAHLTTAQPPACLKLPTLIIELCLRGGTAEGGGDFPPRLERRGHAGPRERKLIFSFHSVVMNIALHYKHQHRHNNKHKHKAKHKAKANINKQTTLTPPEAAGERSEPANKIRPQASLSKVRTGQSKRSRGFHEQTPFDGRGVCL